MSSIVLCECGWRWSQEGAMPPANCPVCGTPLPARQWTRPAGSEATESAEPDTYALAPEPVGRQPPAAPLPPPEQADRPARKRAATADARTKVDLESLRAELHQLALTIVEQEEFRKKAKAESLEAAGDVGRAKRLLRVLRDSFLGRWAKLVVFGAPAVVRRVDAEAAPGGLTDDERKLLEARQATMKKRQRSARSIYELGRRQWALASLERANVGIVQLVVRHGALFPALAVFAAESFVAFIFSFGSGWFSTLIWIASAAATYLAWRNWLAPLEAARRDYPHIVPRADDALPSKPGAYRGACAALAGTCLLLFGWLVFWNFLAG